MTEKAIQKRLREGRGQGQREQYRPWLTVQDVPSRGRATRIKSILFDRVVHVLSKLELYVLYMIEFLPNVWDIQEQYPLSRETTRALAEERGIRHPVYPDTQVPIVMTTDFLVTVRQGVRKTKYAIAVKYDRELKRSRIRRKLDLEQAYWECLPTPIPHVIVTEKKVPIAFVENVQFVHPYRHPEALYPLTNQDIRRVDEMLTPWVRRQRGSLADLCEACDRRLKLRTGMSLKVARHLLAKHAWPIDWNRPIIPRQPLSLDTRQMENSWLERRAAG